MELEIYNAFVRAGVTESDAKAVVESIKKVIDKRCAVHAQRLATRGDIRPVSKDVAEADTTLARVIAEVQKSIADMSRWTIAAVFASLVAMAATCKLL